VSSHEEKGREGSNEEMRVSGQVTQGEGTRVKLSLFRHSGDDLVPENALEVLEPSDAFDPLIRSGDWQTILAHFWPARLDHRRYASETRLFETEPGVRIVAHCDRTTDFRSNGTVLIIHGLEGSSASPYVVRMAARALDAGFQVVRMNVRNCGGTEHLGPTLYHSGLTTDLRSVAEQLWQIPLYIVGFSMGGNMALKLAGEWSAGFPPQVKAICAVSPPVDLGACALRIAEPRNHVYESRFLRHLRQTLTRKKAVMAVDYSLEPFSRIRSLIDFDNAYTAPAFGFCDAFDYYAHASSKGHLRNIRLPALVIQAQDDPFIPFAIFNSAVFRENPSLSLLTPRSGGHVAFISRRQPRFWAQEQALRFFEWVRGRMAVTTEVDQAAGARRTD
jgi:uncharacterized protein